MSIDTIYNIDNRLTEILAKNWKYWRYIDLGAIYRFGGDISLIIFDFLSMFIEKLKKKKTIFEVGVLL